MSINPFEEIIKRLDAIEKRILEQRQPTAGQEADEIIDRPTLCKRLGISAPTAIRLSKKSIPVIRAGGSVRYNWQEVLKALQKQNPR